MQPEVDYLKIGQRIKSARLEQGLNQAELGKLVGCSNNHMSHIEIGQTKVSLSMLLRISYVLKKDLNYFLLDTPYAQRESIVNGEIATERRGTDGFGYDPVFIPEDTGKTFAELGVEQKNQMSHRARAVRKLCDFILAL